MVRPPEQLRDRFAGERFVSGAKSTSSASLQTSAAQTDAALSAYYKHIKRGGAAELVGLASTGGTSKKQGRLYVAQHGPLLRRSGLQWPGRAPDVHRLAPMGLW